jgi:hypothetical protein
MNNPAPAAAVAEPVIETPVAEEAKATETAEQPPEPAQETEADKESKRAAKIEARFARLTREKYELKARLDAMERYGRPQTQEQSPQQDGEAEIESLIERKVAEREQAKIAESFTKKSQSILEKAAEVGGFDIDDFIPIPRGAADAIVELDNPKLVAHLQNNPDLIEKLSTMSPYMQAVEIGKLEAKISQPAPVKKSGAPAPIAPVTGNAKPTGYRENMSQAEYEEWRNSTSKKRR